MKSLAIDLICIDGGTQFRASTNDAKVTEYTDILGAATDWPFDTPCDVFFDGVKYYLVDGFHRYHAAHRANRASLNCNVHNGTLRDAIVFALKANARHGLHRSNDDKRKAVSFVLADAEWSKLSSRAIAEMCGVSDRFVCELRKDSVANGSQHSEKVIGKDGKSYPTQQRDSGANRSHLSESKETEPDWLDVDDDEPIATPTKPKSDLPPEIADALENGKYHQSLLNDINGLIRNLDAIPEAPGTSLLLSRRLSMTREIEGLKGKVLLSKPHAVCPRCKGVGCVQCGNYGWVSSAVYKELTK